MSNIIHVKVTSPVVEFDALHECDDGVNVPEMRDYVWIIISRVFMYIQVVASLHWTRDV